jgi:hypothetical protein
MVAVNISATVKYGPIKRYFEAGLNEGKWDYEESCLAHDPAKNDKE